HSVWPWSAGQNAPGETSIVGARVSARMEPLAAPCGRKLLWLRQAALNRVGEDRLAGDEFGLVGRVLGQAAGLGQRLPVDLDADEIFRLEGGDRQALGRLRQ